jgi:hypothetical protein
MLWAVIRIFQELATYCHEKKQFTLDSEGSIPHMNSLALWTCALSLVKNEGTSFSDGMGEQYG